MCSCYRISKEAAEYQGWFDLSRDGDVHQGETGDTATGSVTDWGDFRQFDTDKSGALAGEGLKAVISKQARDATSRSSCT